jgi:hypothetical protein
MDDSQIAMHRFVHRVIYRFGGQKCQFGDMPVLRRHGRYKHKLDVVDAVGAPITQQVAAVLGFWRFLWDALDSVTASVWSRYPTRRTQHVRKGQPCLHPLWWCTMIWIL